MKLQKGLPEKFSRNSSGFAVLEGLLILVIVGILAGTCWYVMKAKDQTNKAYDTTASSSLKASSKGKTSATSPSTQKYLTIKEWGVRIPYQAEDTLSYKILNNRSLEVISKQLVDKYRCTELGGGGVERSGPKDNVGIGADSGIAEEVAKESPDLYFKVGNYYYDFGHDQAACSDTVTAEAENNANNFTKSILPKIEVIPQ